MASLEINLVVSGLDAAIAKLNAAGRVIEGGVMLDGLGALGVAQTQRRMATEKTTPEGAPWPPNKAGTSILMRTGSHLYDSLAHVVRGAQVAWGSGWIGARVHQFGATIRPVNARFLAFSIGGRKVFAKQVTIPARAYLGVSPANARELDATAVRYISRVLE